MIIVDAHCDTITKIMESNANLYKNESHVDIVRMKNAGNFVQFFAAFIEPAYCQAYALKRAIQIIDKFYEQLDIHKDDIMLCCNYNEIITAVNQCKVGAILSIEGGEALQGSLSALRIFYRLGVRSICLTWNHRNEIADGVADGSSGGGLTPFGRDVIKEMNSLGMLVDLSHISEKGFWDAIELSSLPIITSHSNAKKICNNKRNLNDEQIAAIRKNGGVIGINLFPSFLNEAGKATTKDIVKHIEHIVALTGYEHIGLGADFDGIDNTPEDVAGLQDIGKIFNELIRLNYPQEFIEKLAGGNFLRVIKEVL
ncbi:MAG: dipeptidase [Clostridia bacterium]|nr:dipeptidase [Clostridia bacterium]